MILLPAITIQLPSLTQSITQSTNQSNEANTRWFSLFAVSLISLNLYLHILLAPSGEPVDGPHLREHGAVGQGEAQRQNPGTQLENMEM